MPCDGSFWRARRGPPGRRIEDGPVPGGEGNDRVVLVGLHVIARNALQGRKSAPHVRATSRSAHKQVSVLRPEKGARNAPERYYSRLHRAGVFAAVVAQSIQHLSAVSITYKTVGNRLPCLWCGAVG